MLSRNLVIDGCELLAVSTPRSVELNKHGLVLVEGNLVEVGGHQHLDGLGIPVLWQVLGQQMLLQIISFLYLNILL